jgi:hypothetical protein
METAPAEIVSVLGQTQKHSQSHSFIGVTRCNKLAIQVYVYLTEGQNHPPLRSIRSITWSWSRVHADQKPAKAAWHGYLT